MTTRSARAAIFLPAGLLLAWYVGSILGYLAWPGFVDHIEAHFVAQAQALLGGGELYVAVDAANRSTMLYGPTGYLANLPGVLLVRDPMLGAKLGGAALALAALALVIGRLRQLAGWTVAAVGGAYHVLMVSGFANASYWNRSDSLLLAGSALSYAAVLLSRPAPAILLSSLGAGLAAGGKITSAICFLPVAWIVLRRWGWRAVALWIALCAGWTMAPFALAGQISLPRYLAWLQLMTGHPLQWSLATASLRRLLLILVPAGLVMVVAVRGGRMRPLLRDISFQALLLLALAGLLAVPAASKAGSGPHHLMPLIPAAAILTVWGYTRLRRQDAAPLTWRGVSVMLLLVSAWALPVVRKDILTQARLGSRMDGLSYLATARNELQEIRSRHPGASVAMGYAGGDWYSREYTVTFLRPLLDNPENFLDAPALMDMQAAGVPLPDATREKMRARPYDLYLIPRGGPPFSLRNQYTARRSQPIFEDLSASFLAAYTPVDATRHFQVWAAYPSGAMMPPMGSPPLE